jgi:hypothetical protein
MRSLSIEPAMRTAVIPDNFAAFSLKEGAASMECGKNVPIKRSSIHKKRIIKTSECQTRLKPGTRQSKMSFFIKRALILHQIDAKEKRGYDSPRFSFFTEGKPLSRCGPGILSVPAGTKAR